VLVYNDPNPKLQLYFYTHTRIYLTVTDDMSWSWDYIVFIVYETCPDSIETIRVTSRRNNNVVDLKPSKINYLYSRVNRRYWQYHVYYIDIGNRCTVDVPMARRYRSTYILSRSVFIVYTKYNKRLLIPIIYISASESYNWWFASSNPPTLLL